MQPPVEIPVDCFQVEIPESMNLHLIPLVIKETEYYLMTGKLTPTIIQRLPNGKFKPHSIVSYLVAHTLNLPTIPVQHGN